MSADIYFIIFTIVFIINFLASRTKKKWLRILFITLSVTILLLFIGLRYNVGTDYENYLAVYNQVTSGNFEDIFRLKLEPVLGIMYWGVSKIFVDFPYWIFFLYGIAAIIPIYLLNKQYNYRYLHYSVLLYCFLFLPFGLNGMRQGASISLCLLTFSFIEKKSYGKAAISYIIALVFHRTSLLALPHIIGYMVSRKINIKFWKVNLLITTIISLSIFSFLGDFLMSRDMDFYSYLLTDASLDNISILHALNYLPILLIILFCGTTDSKRNNIFYRNMLYSGFIYYIVGGSVKYLDRISLYFLPVSIILIPIYLENMKNRDSRRLMKILTIAYAIAFFIIEIVINGWHEILPYQTWLGMV